MVISSFHRLHGHLLGTAGIFFRLWVEWPIAYFGKCNLFPPRRTVSHPNIACRLLSAYSTATKVGTPARFVPQRWPHRTMHAKAYLSICTLIYPFILASRQCPSSTDTSIFLKPLCIFFTEVLFHVNSRLQVPLCFAYARTWHYNL